MSTSHTFHKKKLFIMSFKAMPVLLLLALSSCNTTFIYKDKPLTEKAKADSMSSYGGASDSLPNPYATPSVYNFSSVQGWKDGQKPTAPEGFEVSLFAGGLDKPRWVYEMENGDIIVSESKADRLTLFRDLDADGFPDTSFVFKNDLDKPLGMLYLNGYFYVANTGEILRFKHSGNGPLQGEGEKILELPANGYNAHWTRNLIASNDKSKIYVTVGSASNVAENGMDGEVRRANILEINPDGSGEKIYASGLRNPVGMDWNPVTGELWTAVNERDALGDNLVPDYITSVKEGGFYGWPYLYFGNNIDPRWKDDLPENLPKSIKDGKPTGKVEKFLNDFISDLKDEKVHGRPVGVFVLKDGSMLVTEDGGGTVWKVKAL